MKERQVREGGIGMLDFMMKHRKDMKKIILLLCILVLCVLKMPGYVYAKGCELPEEVVTVENEEMMIRMLIKGMRKHQSYFAFYYQGIENDFIRYGKKSSGYQLFFDKLARKDGYITGVLSGSCVTICGKDMKYVTFQFGYLTTIKQEKAIDKKVKRIVRKIGKGSTVVKIKNAHDYLVKYMRYDERYYNPYYAFKKGRGMCMSYALAYQRILQEMKIPCIYIKGKNHAWNMVKIGKYWYNVDVTWDDAGDGYQYFLKSDAEFSGHKRPNSKWLKSLRKAKRSYPLWKIH